MRLKISHGTPSLLWTAGVLVMTPLILAAGVLVLIWMLAVGAAGLRGEPVRDEAGPAPAPAIPEARLVSFAGVPVSQLRRAA